jgi:aminopeptidase N
LIDLSEDGSFSFQQSYESPSYTYGFAIGNFNKQTQKVNQININNYSAAYNADELEQIFQYTGDMLRFFEEKSGIPFVQETYSQVLMGKHYQEMSGLSVLKNSYGKMILADSTETNLISHELAHQWWGNMITCENWNHFWLNEAMATFMSAAYNEHRFGKEKYERDINSYKKVYEDILAKGHDKPLVFPNWNKPSGDDRSIVYFKGAYVLHLLKKDLGEEAFWKGIKYYSTTYWGKAVNSKDFQKSLEQSSGKSLATFFENWIY